MAKERRTKDFGKYSYEAPSVSEESLSRDGNYGGNAGRGDTGYGDASPYGGSIIE